MRTAWWAPAAFLIALAIALPACRNESGSATEMPTPEILTATAIPIETSTTPAVSESPTEAPTATPTQAPTATPTPSPTDLALEAWEEYWTIAVSADGEERPGSRLTDAVEAQAADRIDNATGEAFNIELASRATVQSESRILIEDCVIVYDDDDPDAKPLFNQAANLMLGAVENDGSGWVMNTIRQSGPCIPKETADQVLQHYEEFWDALAEFWNPADPNHPLVEQTMTGTYLDEIVPRLMEDQQRGWALVDSRPQTSPEVLRMESNTRVVLSDCQQPNSRQRLIDENDERQPGVNQPVDDQRDILQATLELEDGRWRVETLGLIEQFDCEFAPTDAGVQVVG